MQVAVLGPGGVGGLIGALLSRDGVPVVFVARPSTVEHLRMHGITVRSGRYGNFTIPADAATRCPTTADIVLVTVKATDLEAAVGELPRAGDSQPLLAPMLNGIDHVAALRAQFGVAAVAPATIRIESTRVAPGQIEHTSPFALVELAANPQTSDRVENLAAQLRNAGIDVTVRTDEAAMLWDKLALLAPLALLTTLARADLGTSRRVHRDDLLACVREIAEVANADGAAIDADRIIATLDAAPPTMQSSMQRDDVAGRPLELDAIGGAVLARAARDGIETPVTARIVSALRERSRERASAQSSRS